VSTWWQPASSPCCTVQQHLTGPVKSLFPVLVVPMLGRHMFTALALNLVCCSVFYSRQRFCMHAMCPARNNPTDSSEAPMMGWVVASRRMPRDSPDADADGCNAI